MRLADLELHLVLFDADPYFEKDTSSYLFRGKLHQKGSVFSLLGGRGYLKAPMLHLFRGMSEQKGPVLHLLGGWGYLRGTPYHL